MTVLSLFPGKERNLDFSVTTRNHIKKLPVVFLVGTTYAAIVTLIY